MEKVSERKENENRLLILWIIWGAIFGSLLIYVFICCLLYTSDAADELRSV